MYTQLGPTGPTGPMPTDYVSSFNGLTGAVQGVSSINGATGAITNVAKTNVDNNFTSSQTILANGALLTVQDTTSSDSITIDPSQNKITFRDDTSENSVHLIASVFDNQDITLPSATTTIAGLEIHQTFTELQEFSGSEFSPIGISAIQINTENLISNSNVLLLAGGGDRFSQISIDGTEEGETIVITAGNSEIEIRDAEFFISSAEINIGSETYTYISGDEVTISAYAPEGPNSGIVSLQSNEVEVVNIHSNGVTFNANINAPNIVNSINGNTGNISNVAFRNTAQSFTGLQQFTQGISGSGGITFNSDVNINVDNSLVVATITNTAGGKSQLDIDNRASSRVAIGDFDSSGNSTYIFLRDNISNLQISNPYGAIDIGDPNGISAGNLISYSSPDATLYGNDSNIDGFANIFASYVSASQGISASGGVTFSGNVNFKSTISINGSTGSNGQVLTTTNSGITWSTASGGSKTYAVFTPLDNQPPASNFATLDTRNSIAVLDFDASTDESSVFVGVIPEGASLGSGLKIRISWMATSATSGACRWGVQIERMNTDEDSDSFDTAATGGSTTNGTSGIVTTTEITVTTIDSVAAGEPFRLKVFRDADGTSGTDDMTGDAELVAVEVRSAS
jgi:hypothetical protein